jgi:GDP-4-dehydro-6-deoxy-D-mannose reductase
MRVLITGITGFVGSHLADYALTGPGVEVYGCMRWRSNTEHIDAIRSRLHLVQADLSDSASTRALVAATRPDRVFHLAAQSFVPATFSAPSHSMLTNVLCQVNLFEALRAERLAPRILVTGSSEEYGLVHPHEVPVKETNELRPLSPYAVSKVAQDLLGYQYWKSYGLPIIRSRAFNHCGPRRLPVFVSSSFARQVAEIEAGRQEPVIRVGNLTARRDFFDVRDVVRGYWRLLEDGDAGEVYNLCSGRDWSIGQVLDFLLGLSTVPGIVVQTDQDRLRPSDIPLIVGDPTRIAQALGWRTEIPFERTLADLLDYWRQRVRRGG